jgi:hypothetical protein
MLQCKDYNLHLFVMETSVNRTERFLQLDINLEENFGKLNALQKLGAKMSLQTLKKANELGYIDIEHIKKIADFGAGMGGPTFTLTQITDDVDAFEALPIFAQSIIDSNILQRNNVFIGDGIQNLERIKGKQYDLVTSFMHGPDGFGNLFIKLAKICTENLSDHGNLLMTFAHQNEQATFSAIINICQKHGINYKIIDGLSFEGKEVPPAIIIPKNELIKIGVEVN